MKKKLWILLLAAAITAVGTIPYGIAQAEGGASEEVSEEVTENAGELDGTEIPKEPAQELIVAQAEVEVSDAAPQTEENFDITSPVINSISIDKQGQTVLDGDTVTISVDAYDAGVGIEQVEVSLRYVAKDDGYNYGSDYRTLSLSYNAITNKYEYSTTMDGSASGKYFVSAVTVTDKKGNYIEGIVDVHGRKYVEAVGDALYWYEVKHADSEAPVIESIQLTKDGAEVTAETVLAVGDTVHVAVKVTDNIGLAASASMEILCSDNNYWGETLSLQYQQESLCYEGEFAITDDCHPGKWFVRSVSAQDTSGNYTMVYGRGLGFCVQNDGFDTTRPVVKAVSLDRSAEVLHSGDFIKIRADVTHASGIDGVWARLRAAANRNSETEILLTRVGETDTYEGTFTVTEDTYPCEWYLEYIIACGANGKYVYQGSNPSTGAELERDYYFNVKQGNTFVNPTYRVTFAGLDASDEVVETEFEVPRRTTAEELFQLQIDLPEHPQLNFVEWVLSDGVGVVYDDPIDVILSDSDIWAKYDKVAVEFIANINTDKAEGDSITVKKEYVKPGSVVELPKEVKGYKNIVWRNWHGEIITQDTVTVDEDAFWFYIVHGSAEIDSENPPTPNAPGDAQNPAEPGQTTPSDKPAVLTEQQIADLIAQVNQAAEGSEITVPMDKATVMPKDVIEAIRGRDIDLVLQMNGYTWTINGKTVLSTNLTDVNLEVTRNTSYIPGAVISELAGTNPVEQISLTHDGNFGFTAVLTMNMGSQNAGKKGNLYYHDSDGKMVFIDAGVIEENGNVSLAFSHASDYVIVIEQNAVPVKASAAKTGDSTPMLRYVLMMLSAGAVVTVAVTRRRICRKKAVRL